MADETNERSDQEDDVLHLAIDLEVIVLRKEQSEHQSQRNHCVAVELQPDGAEDEEEQDLEEIDGIGLLGTLFLCHAII